MFDDESTEILKADLAKLIQAIYSPEVTAELKRVNYMPVPATERQSLLAEFE